MADAASDALKREVSPQLILYSLFNWESCEDKEKANVRAQELADKNKESVVLLQALSTIYNVVVYYFCRKSMLQSIRDSDVLSPLAVDEVETFYPKKKKQQT
ncbi:MAG: hypothetical protein WAX66_04340 [Patescibacteria group bacterium]